MSGQQGDDVVKREPGQVHAGHELVAAEIRKGLRQRMRPREVGVAIGPEHQQRRRRGVAGEMAQQQERRRVRPMQVVKHEHGWSGAGQRAEDGGHRLEHAVAVELDVLGRHAEARRFCFEAGNETSQLGPVAAQLGTEVLGGANLGVASEGLDERLIRNERLLVASSVEHIGTRGVRLAGELADEAGGK